MKFRKLEKKLTGLIRNFSNHVLRELLFAGLVVRVLEQDEEWQALLKFELVSKIIDLFSKMSNLG